MKGEKASVSVAQYNDELDIEACGKGANKWADQTVNLKDYAEYGKQLPLANTKVLDDMVDLPYLHEVRRIVSLVTCKVFLAAWHSYLLS